MKTIITLFAILIISINSYSQCVPVLHYDGCDLETVDQSFYQSFQWYRGTVPIEDAIEFTYEPIEPGMYMVRTVDLNGCVGYSKRYKIINWCGVGKSKN
jgi:hypothetical protein